MINIFEEAFKANAALSSNTLNESTSTFKNVNEDTNSNTGYEATFRKLLADSDNLSTGYFNEKTTEVSDSGFKLYSQVASLEVEFEPNTSKYSVYIVDSECPDCNETRHGIGFNELIDELEDLTNNGYTWFINLENAFDYYKLDESLEEDVNEVEIKTDDETVEINIDDNGEVTVDVEAEEPEAEEVEDTVEVEDDTAEDIIEDEEIIEEPVEEGLFGKKKSASKNSNSKASRVTFKIYDGNGTLQFNRTFDEIPGKMSAEEQLKNVFKDSAVYRKFKQNNPRDWFYERESNPESNYDTKNKRGTQFLSDIGIYEAVECKESVALNKIRFTEDIDSFQPEDELMVVYNSDLDDEMTEEEIQAEAESLIGCDICKCGVCGANYVCKEDETPDAQDIVVIDEEDVKDGAIEEIDEKSEEDFNIEESVLFKHLNEADGEEDSEEAFDEETNEVEEEHTEETTTTEEAEKEDCCSRVCPICGATENQVLTATIAPIEENSEEDETTSDAVTEETDEDNMPDAELNLEVDSDENETDIVAESIGHDGIFKTGNELVALEPIFYSNVDDLGWEQSDIEHFEKLGYIEDNKVILPRGTKLVVGEKAPSGNGVMIKLIKANEELEFVYEDENDERFLVVDTISEVEESVETKPLMETTLEINESDINKLFTKFARENYENVVNVRINSGKLINGQVCLEGYVRAKSGVKRPIKLVSEGLNVSENTTKVKIIEKGPFTENAQIKDNRVPFVLECVVSEGKMSFTGLKYNYVVTENTEKYSVSGKVVLG